MKKTFLKNFIIVVTILFALKVIGLLLIIFYDIEISITEGEIVHYPFPDYLYFLDLIISTALTMTGLRIIKSFK